MAMAFAMAGAPDLVEEVVAGGEPTVADAAPAETVLPRAASGAKLQLQPQPKLLRPLQSKQRSRRRHRAGRS